MMNPSHLLRMRLSRHGIALAFCLLPVISFGQEPLPDSPLLAPAPSEHPTPNPATPFSRELQAPAQPEQPVRELDSRPVPPPPVQQGITAMEALRRLGERFGKGALSLIVEMKGLDGQTQPSSWKVVTVDLEQPFLTHTYAVDMRGQKDEGDGKALYPDNIPRGFISLSNLTVGSYDAFIALDKAATEAKIGFDSIEYHLRAREGNNEPVWTMTAIDGDGLAAGVVDVSGVSGKVLRTVWLRRSGARSIPTIEDSALKKALRN
ncbi:MAG: hypothetical protein KDN22_24775 [Verrucomicrobiae bacterium]|nr:hypothetical protein [Verrucomicrobiae bacterium]